ncbi:MAG: hypothetical protein KDK70_01700 [Myxococcales bacterium]|nr:hypothetical protein [Myxococcales bacterium]
MGERSGTLQWRPSEQFVRGFPPPSEVGITVEIHPPSTAWDVEIESQLRRNERLLCTHWLETEFEVELRSDDGVLDAKLLDAATSSSPDSLWTYADVTELDLGTLSFDPIEEGASLHLRLSYDLENDPTGALILSTGASDDSGNGAGMTVELATWTLN